MATEHTPGPWTVAVRGETLSVRATEPDGLKVYPAQINGDPESVTYGPTTWANARLIAAAPDLLAACKAMLARWEQLYPLDHQGPQSAARAAIAKAESP